MWKTDCVVAVQIKKLLEVNKDGAKKKEYQELYWEWLSVCAKQGVEAVGKEVRMLPRDSSVVRGSRVSSEAQQCDRQQCSRQQCGRLTVLCLCRSRSC